MQLDTDPPPVALRSGDTEPPKIPRAVIRQSSDGFEPLEGLKLVRDVDELRHGDRVLGGVCAWTSAVVASGHA